MAEGKTEGKGISFTCHNCGVVYDMDEYGELTERYKNEIPLLGLQSLMLRNQLISDNSLPSGNRNRDKSLYSANEERY